MRSESLNCYSLFFYGRRFELVQVTSKPRLGFHETVCELHRADGSLREI